MEEEPEIGNHDHDHKGVFIEEDSKGDQAPIVQEPNVVVVEEVVVVVEEKVVVVVEHHEQVAEGLVNADVNAGENAELKPENEWNPEDALNQNKLEELPAHKKQCKTLHIHEH